ncbi:hypothetical protein FH972_021489 [Carpinus fangiana]|uniref:Alkyl transferase n=1 Tax=Carpinus fangiana TaxID=176857 RepID=A0A5N6KPU5_9ROSI|nr:hypothetical protein FH972_021489 [Carpinus fangiana]
MTTSLRMSSIRNWILQSPPAEWALSSVRDLLIGALKQGPIPRHVAFVMDGNRRFARHHHIETVEGHNLGFEALARILEVCYRAGVRVVTIYAFSIENFKRPKYEVDALMEMARVKLTQLAQHGELLDRYGASIRVLGQRHLIRADVLEAIDEAVNLTAHNDRAVLNVCFPYTSRDEITTAIRNTVADYSRPLPPPGERGSRPFSESSITRNINSTRLSTLREEASPDTLPAAEHVSASAEPNFTSHSTSSLSSAEALEASSPPTSHLHSPEFSPQKVSNNAAILPDPETITAQTLTDHMFTADCPPLDLLVRTSGVERLSDFMLWQCHEHTSIVFLKCLWPEFDLWQFLPVLVEWQWWRRRALQKSVVEGLKGDIHHHNEQPERDSPHRYEPRVSQPDTSFCAIVYGHELVAAGEVDERRRSERQDNAQRYLAALESGAQPLFPHRAGNDDGRRDGDGARHQATHPRLDRPA